MAGPGSRQWRRSYPNPRGKLYRGGVRYSDNDVFWFYPYYHLLAVSKGTVSSRKTRRLRLVRAVRLELELSHHSSEFTCLRMSVVTITGIGKFVGTTVKYGLLYTKFKLLSEKWENIWQGSRNLKNVTASSAHRSLTRPVIPLLQSANSSCLPQTSVLRNRPQTGAPSARPSTVRYGPQHFLRELCAHHPNPRPFPAPYPCFKALTTLTRC